MANAQLLKIAGAVAASFLGLVGGIIYLAAARIITPQLALLMLVALAGLYIGFGVLVLVHRLVQKLD